jgi:hypothetical protein
MDETAGWIGLLRMDQNAADERGLSVARQARSLYALTNHDNAVGMQPQPEQDGREQFMVGTIEHEGLLRSHGN